MTVLRGFALEVYGRTLRLLEDVDVDRSLRDIVQEAAEDEDADAWDRIVKRGSETEFVGRIVRALVVVQKPRR